MLGSPPALVGWLVALCAVITVAVCAALMVVPDWGSQPVLTDPDASRIARVLPPPGAGGRLFLDRRGAAAADLAARLARRLAR